MKCIYKRQMDAMILFSIFFFLINLLLVKFNFTTQADIGIFLYFQSYNHNFAYTFFSYLTNFSGELFAICFIIFINSLLLKLKKIEELIFVSTFFLSSTLIGIILKYTLLISRPNGQIHGLTGYSFPSGHAILALTMVLIIYVLTNSTLNFKPIKFVIYFLLSSYLILSILSRIIIGAHWLSDVTAGIFVTTFCFALSCKIWRLFYRPSLKLLTILLPSLV